MKYLSLLVASSIVSNAYLSIPICDFDGEFPNIEVWLLPAYPFSERIANGTEKIDKTGSGLIFHSIIELIPRFKNTGIYGN